MLNLTFQSIILEEPGGAPDKIQYANNLASQQKNVNSKAILSIFLP